MNKTLIFGSVLLLPLDKTGSKTRSHSQFLRHLKKEKK